VAKSSAKSPAWQRKQSHWQRQTAIFSVATQLGWFIFRDRLIGNNNPRLLKKRAQWFVNQLIDLGPTFIKIGQSMSTRADLLPLEFTNALSKLQDDVPEFPPEQAIACIESEFKKSIYAVYRDFERYPIACASLGQVHRARLHTGEEVVVKVQRPGLEKLISTDYEVLKKLIGICNNWFANIRQLELETIHEQFFNILYQEIDYINEGHNGDRFRKNFQGEKRIVVPKVYWDFTTKKVLTLEYVPGIKIDDQAGLTAHNIQVDNIIELGICSFLKQLLKDGFFQSDPHPGNMAVTDQGKLIFYDFGTMTEVQSMAQEQMIQTFFAVLRKDADQVLQTFIYMGLIEPMDDMTPIKRMIAFLLDNFRDKPIDVRAFDQISSEMYLMFEQQPFRLPPQMTFIIKSLTTLDGIARALDPQYNLLAASKPFIQELTLAQNRSGLVKSLATQATSFIKYQLDKPSKSQLAIERLEQRLEFGELQVRVRSLENERLLRRIYLALKTMTWAGLTGASFLGSILLIPHSVPAAIGVGVITGLFSIMLLIAALKLMIREKLDRLAK
jgi:predicted unusual protein kinase regulating ubiquinone biosynthesis (AarF/ABC1/UbiB family)